MSNDQIGSAAAAIRDGRLVVFPTETVYGLGADALNAQAVASIFAAKGRPADNPLIVHIARVEQARPLVRELPDEARVLFTAFAPGPLTLVLTASELVPGIVTAGLPTVAIRVPGHELARELLLACDRPVAAPSANRSGEPSPTTVEMARRSLGNSVAVYLDGGCCRVGLESTVIAVQPEAVVILRPGAIGVDDVRRVLPDTRVDLASHGGERPASPGMKHRHYRPRATVIAAGDGVAPEELRAAVRDVSVEARVARSVRCVVIGMGRVAKGYAQALARFDDIVVPWSRAPASLDEYARGLYAWFSEADEERADVIVALVPPPDGLGAAIRDRLVRASSAVLAGHGGEAPIS